MGTENDQSSNDDPNEDETPDPNETEDNKLIRDLRKQLRIKDKELGTLRPLKKTNAFLEAGLGNLSEDHKTALTAVVGEDFTKDNLLAKAMLLGFKVDETTDEERQEKQIQNEVETIQHGEQSIKKPTAKPDTRDLLTRMKDAKSQDELMRIIAEYGEPEGLLVEQEF